jgi:mRNA interferase RelE/StbE
MDYKLLITEEAKRQIDKLDGVVKKRIAKKLPVFLKNPLSFSKPLINFETGQYRFRVGDYRIIFDLRGDEVEILKVMHRKEVYK